MLLPTGSVDLWLSVLVEGLTAGRCTSHVRCVADEASPHGGAWVAGGLADINWPSSPLPPCFSTALHHQPVLSF